jgi:hypothetical protein
MARGNTHKAAEIAASSYGFSLFLKIWGKIYALMYFTVFAKAYRECRTVVFLHSSINV